VNDATKVRSGQGQTGDLGDLQLGDSVLVQAQPAAPGAIQLATGIQVQPRSEEGTAPGTATPNRAPGSTAPPSAPPARPEPESKPEASPPSTTTQPQPEK
jgi:hypothetical protein